MAKNLTKKQSDIYSFQNLKTNKYFKSILVSYVMLTRNIDLFEASNQFNEEQFFEEIFNEFIKYNAGMDIDIWVKNIATPTFQVPEYTTMKISSILQILKKTPKS